MELWNQGSRGTELGKTPGRAKAAEVEETPTMEPTYMGSATIIMRINRGGGLHSRAKGKD